MTAGRMKRGAVALIAGALAMHAAPARATVLLGNTAIGTADSADRNGLNGSRVVVGSTPVVLSAMSVYVGAVDAAPNDRYQLAIYADAAGVPGSLVIASAPGTLTANAWNTLAVATTLQAHTAYWLVYNTNARTDALNDMYYTAAALGRGAFSNADVAFGTWPASFGAATITAAAYALYATAESSTDPVPPSVTLTAPAQGATVSGTVSVTATASDNVGVAGVQFRVDGHDLGAEATAAPYGVAWDSAAGANGPHTLTAVARDAAGNLTTSAAVTVAVANDDLRSTRGDWSAVMDWPLIAIHAVLLKTSKVLVWDEQDTVTQPKLWDPATGAFADTPLVNDELFCAGQTQLADGRVLVAGGHQPHQGEVGIKATWEYLPDTDTWLRGSDMHVARWYPALTKLSDGRVVIFSGQVQTDIYADVPEVYDPAAATVTLLSGISTPELHEEEYPANYHLPNGRLLAISPEHGGVQLFDVAAGAWTHLNTTPIRLGSTVQYRPGKVLMAGGGSAFLAASEQHAATLDVGAPAPSWQPTGSMAFGRYMHSLVMLPTGDVLAVGGSTDADEQSASPTLPAEVWDPQTGAWSTLAALTDPRMYHSTALLLPDGRVLVAGGGHNGAEPNFYSAQLFSPPYLFQGIRPVIDAAPAALTYGAPEAVIATPDAARIASVSLIALGAATHSNDMDQFYTELAFSTAGGEVHVIPPASADAVPPGYYMLFLVDDQRVPSQAAIVRVGAVAGCAPAERPQLVVSRLGQPSGTERLSLQGTARITGALDPRATGVHLTITGVWGPVLDVSIPGGAYGGQPAAGWTSDNRRWVYRNKNDTPPGGVVRLAITRSTAGILKIRVTGRGGSYALGAADLPLSWRANLAPAGADTCIAASFPGPAPTPRCRMTTSGSAVTCR
jgi:hypothetical protein